MEKAITITSLQVENVKRVEAVSLNVSGQSLKAVKAPADA
jgi:hypothetical protein